VRDAVRGTAPVPTDAEADAFIALCRRAGKKPKDFAADVYEIRSLMTTNEFAVVCEQHRQLDREYFDALERWKREDIERERQRTDFTLRLHDSRERKNGADQCYYLREQARQAARGGRTRFPSWIVAEFIADAHG
jgi:hypothetical protein